MKPYTSESSYYAVIFTSVRTEQDVEGYQDMAEKMIALAKQQPGFLGVESARNEIGITVSYWESLEAIKAWKENELHLVAQQTGKERWYAAYTTRICKVERTYHFGQEAKL